MALTITEGGFCTASDCYAAVGEDFRLGVDFVEAPSNGYVLMETFIDYGGVYDPTASEDGAGPYSCSDGIDNGPDAGGDRRDNDCAITSFAYTSSADPGDEILWPDSAIEVRGSLGPGLVNHGGITAFISPLPASHYEGVGVEVSMRCGPTPYAAEISLLVDGLVAGTYGSKYVEVEPGKGPIYHTPKVNSITMHCTDVDTDGDGCSDVAEHGPDSTHGGDRDFLNPWDFYDVAGPGGVPVPDGVVDLPNDVLGVIQHLSPTGDPPYDVHYDRGSSAGSSWNGTLPPDGIIDLPNDVLGVIAQGGHSCA